MNEYIMRHDYMDGEDILTVVSELVRCKDCKWYVRSMIKQDGTLDERYKPDWCDLYRKVREETYFCADGERKDDE